MGGVGSGTWQRPKRKSTVENSLTLAIRDFHGLIYPDSWGRLTRRLAGGSTFSINYFVTWEYGPAITLDYRLRDGNVVETSIPLQSTPTQFGGPRWWFTCPLIGVGEPCDRRVGKVHLPPGGRHFACRQCHNLTYRSCQEAHRFERFLDGRDRWSEQMKDQIKGIEKDNRAV